MAAYAFHLRETTTPMSDGTLLADCSCGAEYRVPQGGDEFAALEAEHVRHSGAATYQVQTTTDGKKWIPRQPTPDGLSMVHGGDHWFTEHHQAWAAANLLRCALTWQEVRLVAKNTDGDIIGEQAIL